MGNNHENPNNMHRDDFAMMFPDVKEVDLRGEAWREYDLLTRTYRIDRPQTLFVTADGTNHRVVDSIGVVHCVPAPGHNGTVVRWQPLPGHPLIKA